MNNALRRNIYKNVMLSFAYAATALTVAVVLFHYSLCLYKSSSSCFMAVVKY